MQSHRLSLNALRAFLRAADHRSLKAAAEELGVTASAISHQVRNLEDMLGTALFHRRNNTMVLTDAGQRLFEQAAPALVRLEAAVADVVRATDEVTLISPMSFAVRWLIPRLDRFKTQEPSARIRVETHLGSVPPSTARADLVIAYRKRDTAPEDETELLADICRPYLSPERVAQLADPMDLAAIPALQCSEANWDWAYWLDQAGQPEVPLRFAAHFDLDDAALRASAAGLGMVLAPEFMVHEDLAQNRLTPLQGTPGLRLGAYTLRRTRDSVLVRRFKKWLVQEAACSNDPSAPSALADP